MEKLEKQLELKEVEVFMEYNIVRNNLQEVIDKVCIKYSIPEINYKSFWNDEVGIREIIKKFRGW